MQTVWLILIVISICIIGLLLYLSNKKKQEFDPESNYQDKEFENFLNVLKDTTKEEPDE